MKKTDMMKFRIWVLVELHLSPLYFFHRILKFSSSLRFYDCFFFILWKTLLPIGLRTGPGFNPYGNPGLNFFSKIIEKWFLLLREPESRFSAWFSPNAIHGDSQSENQTENQDENQVLLWEPPNTGPDYWSGPLVPSN